ncbi:MAG: hypothetical protein OJF52_004571 [Nitrospira sp.]|nr:MAG: hypothetical protein OJF52_004571 [Nitrospira sp.]
MGRSDRAPARGTRTSDHEIRPMENDLLVRRVPVRSNQTAS